MKATELKKQIENMMVTEGRAALAAISRQNDLQASDLSKSLEANSFEGNGSFLFQLSANFYWKYVEGGRRAGAKMPPAAAILAWVRKYKIAGNGISENSLVFLIRRSIAINGIKPRPFINQLADKIADEIEKMFAEYLENIVSTIILAGGKK